VFSASLPPVHARAAAWRFTAEVAGTTIASLLPSAAGDVIPEREWEAMEGAVARLSAGEPEAYVLGRASFHNIDVRVDRRALIPRPETELLVETVIDWCRRGLRATPSILDLGTGSGCIALALARALPGSRVTATDICARAASLAAENLRSGAGGGAIGVIRADWLSWTTARWDVIVSNPPYIETGSLSGLPCSVRDWEPRVALDGGADGFHHIGSIIEQASHHLRPGGLLALEVGIEHGGKASSTAIAAGFHDVDVARDLAGRRRVFTAVWEGFS
jgi:release factor glutamine methyltransferase